MADPSLPTADAAQVLTALGTLKETVALSVLAFAAIIIVTWLILRHRDKQAEAKARAEEAKRSEAATARSEASKNDRAKMMRSAWEQLAREVAGMRTDLQKQYQTTDSMASSVKTLSGSVSELHSAIRDVANRQHGGINRGDSIRIVEHAINETLQREVVDIFSYSLRKNDYANRADFIKQRVKTLIGQVIVRIAANLREYRHLSINPACYLAYYRDESTRGVRFKIVDRLWDGVEPLYRAPHPPEGDDPRLDEMRITVANIVADVLTAGRNAAENIYADDSEVERQDPSSLFRGNAAEDTASRRRAHSGEFAPVHVA
jgi:uncharacterized protein YoxC